MLGAVTLAGLAGIDIIFWSYFERGYKYTLRKIGSAPLLDAFNLAYPAWETPSDGFEWYPQSR